ncbi:hypothetical protein KI387_000537, partial [Taxus chinensis]
MGTNSMARVEGRQHKRLKRYVMEAINSPESLKRMFVTLHPSFKAACKSWAQKGTITASDEAYEMTFNNICAQLFSFHSAPLLKKMQRIYGGLLRGLRAQPINLSGTAFHYALKVEEDSKVIIEAMKSKKVRAWNLDSINESAIDLTTFSNIFISHIKRDGIQVADCLANIGVDMIIWKDGLPNKSQEENIGVRENKGEDKLLTYDDVKNMTYTSK